MNGSVYLCCMARYGEQHEPSVHFVGLGGKHLDAMLMGGWKEMERARLK